MPVYLSGKQRSFINEVSFVFLSLSVCPGGGYSHIRAVRVCAARKACIFRPVPLLKTPVFSAWASPKDSTFSTWTAPKDPLFKNIHLFVPLFRPGLLQKIRLLKIYVSLLFLVPKPPRFSVRGRSESPPPHFFCVGPLPKPPVFKLWAAHIYKPLSYMSNPRVRQRKVILMCFPSFFFLCLSVC